MRTKRFAFVLIPILVFMLVGCSNAKALESARAAVDAYNAAVGEYNTKAKSYNDAASQVNNKNSELQGVVSGAQDVINKGEEPFDENTLSELRVPSSWQKFNTEVGLHPTQKPVALIEYLIKTYTNEGDIVLDNCIGSGTTAIACLNLNRNYIGYEIEKKYFDIAQQRIDEHLRKIND